jgi:hypothetical protein
VELWVVCSGGHYPIRNPIERHSYTWQNLFRRRVIVQKCYIRDRKCNLVTIHVFIWLIMIFKIMKMATLCIFFSLSVKRGHITLYFHRTALLFVYSKAKIQFWHLFSFLCKGKGKVIPVQAAVEALRFARVWGFYIFRHSAHRWRQGSLPPRKIPGAHFC